MPAARSALGPLVAALLAASTAAATCPTPGAGYLNFEAPAAANAVAVTPDGSRILAVNAAGNRLAVIDVGSHALVAEVPVGIQPVSVAIHPSGGLAYVANYVSSSISVVDLTRLTVVATIQEVVARLDGGGAPNPDAGRSRFLRPAYVTFAPDGAHAYVALAGMNQVAVLDTASHTIASRIMLDGTEPAAWGERAMLERPVALAVLGNGEYLAVAASTPGNRTEACGAIGSCGSPCQPPEQEVLTAPARPDRDVVIVRLATRQAVALLGDVATVIHAVVAVSGAAPGSHRILLTHADARNLTASGPSVLAGRPWLNRLSHVDFDPAGATFSAPATFDLDAPEGQPVDATVAAATPYGLAVAAGGLRLVTAAASNRLLLVDPGGAVVARIAVGANPTAVVLHPAGGEAYVLNRLDLTLSVVDLASRTVSLTVPIGVNPLPASIQAGARVLHDASFARTASFACSSCHVGAEADDLIWDLGPDNIGYDPGPRASMSWRGLVNGQFYWDCRPINLRQLVEAKIFRMGGASGGPQQRDAESYLLGIPHLPSPERRGDDQLSDAAKAGVLTFFTHAEPASTYRCVDCHVGPNWSSPSLRGLHDLKTMHRDGVPTNQAVLECHDQAHGFGGGPYDWKDAVRSSLISRLPGLADADHPGLLAWFAELSTGLPGILGRQATLTQANRSDPEVGEIEAQLWDEVALEKVLLRADGAYRQGPAQPWSAAHLEWDQSSGRFCGGSLGELSRGQIEAAVAAGDAILTYTGDVWAPGSSPHPGISSVSVDHSSWPPGRELSVGPPHEIYFLGVNFVPGTRLITNGRLVSPAAPIDSAAEFSQPHVLRSRTLDLNPYACGSFTVQAQTPFGRMSNEFLFRVGVPANSAGPDATTCAGTPVVIGDAGHPGLTYAWSPPGDFADPSVPQPTVTPMTNRTYSRLASVAGRPCASSDEVSITVYDPGTNPAVGNQYRLVRSGGGIEHRWPAFAGSIFELRVSRDKDLSSPVVLARVGPGATSYLDPSTPVGAGITYYFMDDGHCP